jgi:hypothetical protein
MSHVRQQIREQVASTCTGLTTTGSNVFQSRVYPLQDSNLPALLIYTTNEDSATDIMGGTLVAQREVVVLIEAFVKANADFDDVVDTICAEVEVALGADRTLNNLAKFIQLTSTEISYNGEGESPVGVVRLSYGVQYRTAVNDPSTSL